MRARASRLEAALSEMTSLMRSITVETGARISVEILTDAHSCKLEEQMVSSHARLALKAAVLSLHAAVADLPFISQLKVVIRIVTGHTGFDMFELEVDQETVIDDEDDCPGRIVAMADRLEAAAEEDPATGPIANFKIVTGDMRWGYETAVIPATHARQAALLYLATRNSDQSLEEGLSLIDSIGMLCPRASWRTPA